MTSYVKLVNGVEVPMTEQEITERQAEEATWVAESQARFNAEQKKQRESAYKREADTLFFKAQRGEATMQEWQDKVAEIRARFPYQE